jgi:2-phosphoglycerate kinase
MADDRADHYQNALEAEPDWKVLLIGGASGSGKSYLAQQLGRKLGIPWIQVDDLRLALQFGGLVDPEVHSGLFAFLNSRDLHDVSLEELVAWHATIARMIAPAIEIVIEHHATTNSPIIIEGDGIDPELLARRVGSKVRGFYLEPADGAELIQNLAERECGPHARTAGHEIPEESERVWTQLAWAHQQWLAQEARRLGVPLLSTSPRETLVERALKIN